ncbi:MAG TPA: MFS transporter [Chloroflexota bacterium]|nr:MFS transporter [Chloroflexota bacterium]
MAGTHALNTLRHRDFMLLWLGQLVSSTGDMMQNVAIAWNMYLLTNSALMIGLMAAVRAVPSVLLSMYGGAFADVVERKRLLLVVTWIQAGVTAVLVAAAFTGHVTVWLLFAITIAGGATNAFANPARTALVPNVVPPAELGNAFAMLTLMRQVANVAGPGVGGILIAVTGLGATYMANAISFLGVIAALVLMGPVPMARAATTGSNWDRIVEGLRFTWREPLLMVPLFIDGLTRLVVSFPPLLPVLASAVFGMGPQGLGWLQSASAAGAVVGGLAMGAGRYGKYPLRLMVGGYLLEGCFIAGLGLSTLLANNATLIGFGLAVAMLFANGVCDVISEVTRTIVLQLKTPDELRGRVNAFSSIVAGNFPQLGQLEMGGVTSALGPLFAGVFGGVMAIGLTLACVAPRRLRNPVLNWELAPLAVEEPEPAPAVAG